jgi:hypothetical protein
VLNYAARAAKTSVALHQSDHIHDASPGYDVDVCKTHSNHQHPSLMCITTAATPPTTTRKPYKW